MTEENLEARRITLQGETKDVYCLGRGPAVIVMHEAPGLYPAVVEFGRLVAAAGFRVYMPSLIGTPFRPMSPGYALQTIARACVSREFATWATRRTSPITAWLRELAKLAHRECAKEIAATAGSAQLTPGVAPGVGVVGMCLTGGFALAMMVEDVVVAPVLSQPSLPFAVTRAQRRDLGIDDATLAHVRRRADGGTCVLGLRFTHDPMVPAERFARLREELGDKFIAVEIDSSWGNTHGIPRTAHSVLTLHRVDRPGHPTAAALEQVLAFFRERLYDA